MASEILSTQHSEEPNHPIAEKIIEAKGAASAHREVKRRGQKDEIVVDSDFVSVKGLAVEKSKIVLSLLVVDRFFHYRRHRRQDLEPVGMQSESWNQEDDQHYRAERSLASRRDSEAA